MSQNINQSNIKPQIESNMEINGKAETVQINQ